MLNVPKQQLRCALTQHSTFKWSAAAWPSTRLMACVLIEVKRIDAHRGSMLSALRSACAGAHVCEARSDVHLSLGPFCTVCDCDVTFVRPRASDTQIAWNLELPPAVWMILHNQLPLCRTDGVEAAAAKRLGAVERRKQPSRDAVYKQLHAGYCDMSFRAFAGII